MSLTQEIKTNSKKSFYKKMIIISIIFLIWYWIYSYIFKKTDVVINQEQKIFSTKTWDLKTYIETDWKVVLKDEINLDFIIPWIINKIYKKEWDEVKVWEKIASLDTKYLDINIDKAQLSLDIAKSNYDLKKRGASIDDLAISKIQLESNIIWLDITKSQANIDLKTAEDNLGIQKENFENTKKQAEIDELNSKLGIETAELDLQTAKSNKDLVIIQEEEKYKNSQNKLVMDIWQLITQVEKNLFDIDVFLWISSENKDQNDNYEMFIWVKNINTKILAENSYKEAKNNFNSFYNNWKTVKQNLDYSKLNLYAIQLKDISSLTNKTLNYTIETIKNSIPSEPNFSQNTIDNYITSFLKSLEDLKWNNANFSTQILVLQESKTSMDYKIDTVKNQVMSLEQKLKISKTSYDKTVLKNVTDISIANQKIELASSSLESIKQKNDSQILKDNALVNISQTVLDSKKQVDLDELEPLYISILSAQKNLDEAIKKKQDSNIISFLDWKIVNIEWKVWESTTSLKNPFVTIINTKELIIESYIEEWDIIKIKNNQDVYINFDSIEWLIIKWTVIYISDKANIDSNWIVSYKTQVFFTSNDKRVKDWMTANLQFVTKEIKNVLIIPVQAVKNINWKASVVLQNWDIRKITTWFTDWKMVEVIIWLKSWEKVKY